MKQYINTVFVTNPAKGKGICYSFFFGYLSSGFINIARTYIQTQSIYQPIEQEWEHWLVKLIKTLQNFKDISKLPWALVPLDRCKIFLFKSCWLISERYSIRNPLRNTVHWLNLEISIWQLTQPAKSSTLITNHLTLPFTSAIRK